AARSRPSRCAESPRVPSSAALQQASANTAPFAVSSRAPKPGRPGVPRADPLPGRCGRAGRLGLSCPELCADSLTRGPVPDWTPVAHAGPAVGAGPRALEDNVGYRTVIAPVATAVFPDSSVTVMR